MITVICDIKKKSEAQLDGFGFLANYTIIAGRMRKCLTYSVWLGGGRGLVLRIFGKFHFIRGISLLQRIFYVHWFFLTLKFLAILGS